jgi:hypothetical protein
VANNAQMRSLYPIQVNRLQPFFLKKDARDLDSLLEEVYVLPEQLQAAEPRAVGAARDDRVRDPRHARANRSQADGRIDREIHNPKVHVYQANGERDNTPRPSSPT